MVTKTKTSQVDRLAKIKEKLKNTDMSSGGGGGFWAPPVGKSVIRILPEVGEMEYFFQTVGKHILSADGKKSVYCPDFTSEGELDCPVCELVDDLRKEKDAASKQLVGQLARRRSYWMNVIVRGSETAGPQIYTPGVQVFSSLTSVIEDPDYGDITDVEKGYDITIEREGTGLDTEYEVRPRRNPSKLSDDPDLVDEWLRKARDLSYVEMTDDPEEDKDISKGHAVWVLPYDRIVREYDLENLENEDEDEEEDEENVGAKKAKSVKPVKKVVEEEDEDDEDEDEEEEPPAKKEVTRRRMARRSSRR